MYRVQRLPQKLRANDVSLLEDLEQRCFPEDTPYGKVGSGLTWWIVWNSKGKAVGFAGSKLWSPDNAVFLCRAGVLPEARGHGLQRRLIRARLRHAREIGATGAMTYTAADNIASMINLIRCGFLPWEPGYAWVGRDGVMYWWRNP